MKVTANKVEPGLYIDDRETPHMWLINGQWKGDGKDDEAPYAIVLHGHADEWHCFRTYSKQEFSEVNHAYKFERLM